MINPILSVDIDWVKSWYQFNLLFEFIVNKFKKCKQIIFIECHHNILKYINDNDRFIINIDEHHDIGEPRHAQDLKFIHVGNWVGHLINKNSIDHYFWLCNTTSQVEEINLNPVRKIESFKILHNLNNIIKFNYDKIIICKSFDYFLPDEKSMGFANLFSLLQIVATNLYKEKLIIDDQSNPYKELYKN